jgi:hypothetical protein
MAESFERGIFTYMKWAKSIFNKATLRSKSPEQGGRAIVFRDSSCWPEICFTTSETGFGPRDISPEAASLCARD